MHLVFTCLGLLLIWTFTSLVPLFINEKYEKIHPGEQAAVSRLKKYISKLKPTLLLAALCLLTANAYTIPVFGALRIDLMLSLMAIGLLALDLCLQPLEWKLTPVGIRKRWLAFFPRTAKERLFWIPISLIVAIAEEITYRAVFFGLLVELSGNYWTAGIISALLFAIIHMSQGLPATFTVFFVALALQYLVIISGGLYIAIAIHFIHNIIIGLVMGSALNRKSEAEIIDSLVE